MIRHSKQRDAIFDNLCSRYDHPTAEDIYFSLKPKIPALSLATVYRNLSQLVEDGKIIISKAFRHRTLEERIRDSGCGLSGIGELDWGEAQGNEVWE
jgi:Fe2+ or Zn2+ uptake regulation protein